MFSWIGGNERLAGSGLGLVLLAVLWIVNAPSAATAHEAETTPVVAHDGGTAGIDWCAHDHEADSSSAGHGGHCFAPAFAFFSSTDQASWFTVNHASNSPPEDVDRHGLTVGTEPPPPRITS